MNYSHFYSNTSIPQLFQKIACWTQNCYYDVLGLYLNAVFLVTSHFFPLPHNATWDNTLYHTHKLKTLSKISLEYIWVSIVTGIDIQYISPWCLDPLGRYWDKLEDKRFYATCSIESEPLDVKSLDNDLVKVTDKCCKKKEHSVLCHEGFWQSVPSESIIHIIEDTFLSSTKVIELDNFSYGRFIVVSQDTTVCVFSFPKILYTIHPFLSLNHKSVCFTLPLFNKDRVQFEFNAIYFFSLPSSEGKDVIVERIVSELQVRSVGWSERWFIKWVVTSSIHEPPQK